MMNNDTLSRLISNIAQSDGNYSTPIKELMIYRRDSATTPMPCIYGLGLGITVQGGKRVTLGNEIFNYGPGESLVTAADLPVVSNVTKASSAEPYLGIYLQLDARIIAQMAANIDFSKPLKESSTRVMRVVAMDEGLLSAVIRLILLLNEPTLITQIAPLIQQEIIVRLLNGQHGPIMRHLVALGSPSQQVVKVMSWLKQNYTGHVSMDNLAEKAHMSPSTFRQYFRSVAGMSPLQYLKNLRLQEARQLMMNENEDAGSAALRVGYESETQFSREYSRLFGMPPLRDIKNLRQTTVNESMVKLR